MRNFRHRDLLETAITCGQVIVCPRCRFDPCGLVLPNYPLGLLHLSYYYSIISALAVLDEINYCVDYSTRY